MMRVPTRPRRAEGGPWRPDHPGDHRPDAGGEGGVTQPDTKAVRDLGRAVQSSLRNHQGGIVVPADLNIPIRWTLRAQAVS